MAAESCTKHGADEGDYWFCTHLVIITYCNNTLLWFCTHLVIITYCNNTLLWFCTHLVIITYCNNTSTHYIQKLTDWEINHSCTRVASYIHQTLLVCEWQMQNNIACIGIHYWAGGCHLQLVSSLSLYSLCGPPCIDIVVRHLVI